MSETICLNHCSLIYHGGHQGFDHRRTISHQMISVHIWHSSHGCKRRFSLYFVGCGFASFYDVVETSACRVVNILPPFPSPPPPLSLSSFYLRNFGNAINWWTPQNLHARGAHFTALFDMMKLLCVASRISQSQPIFSSRAQLEWPCPVYQATTKTKINWMGNFSSFLNLPAVRRTAPPRRFVHQYFAHIHSIGIRLFLLLIFVFFFFL